MGRRKKPRYCREFTGGDVFKPAGIQLTELETVILALDELEAVRLCDLEGADQEQAAEQMGVSRGTIQRLVSSARAKFVDAVVHGKALTVQTGEHVVVRGRGRRGRGPGRRGR